MNGLSLFSGAGIGELAFKNIFPDYCTVGYVEWDKYCQEVIRARIRDGILSDAPIFGDIQFFNERYAKLYIGKVDWISGGFPCQPFSTASHGWITAVDLWPTMFDTIKTILPRYVFVENVGRKPILRAAHDLWQLGYAVQAIKASASDVGADHIRRRYWLLGYPYNDGESMCTLNDETSGMQSISPSFWESNPRKLRMVNGVANRVDRLKAIGNGWVPQCVAQIIQRNTEEINV